MRTYWLGLLAPALLLPALLLGACDKQDEQDKAAPTPLAAVAATQIDGDYLTGGGDGTNWAAIGFNYYEQRFSPLDMIDRSNVGRLGIGWSADLPGGEVPQSTPIAADGKIYITTPRSRVIAFDGATGEQLWSFDAGLTQPTAGQTVTGVGNQGLAIWKGRLFLATLDGQLIALDAITGAQLWSIQTGGEAGAYRITSAPRVVKNMVIIGSGRAASGGGRGYVSAYDATDGALRWRFYTVPGPDETADQASSDAVLGTARQTWSGSALGSAAGGYVTDAVTYDPALDRLYVGVGAGPSADAQAGDRLFLSSIVALDPDDGEFLWHYQETPGSRPAYGASQPFMLAEIAVAPTPPQTGATSPSTNPAPKASPTSAAKPAPPTLRRKVLLHASDNGFFFVIDRTSGKLLSATPLFDQPGWTSGFDRATGRPVRIGPADAGKKTSQIARSLAPVAEPRPIFPPVDAGRAPRWMSFNPATGLVYLTLPSYARQQPAKSESGASEPGVSESGASRNAPSAAPRWQVDGARIVAFDPVAGAIRWSRTLTAPRNGGPLSTAGGLLFVGTGIGRFVALDAATGATLYNRDLGSGIAGAPSTFLIDGVQYVAVLTGLGGNFDWPAPDAPAGDSQSAQTKPAKPKSAQTKSAKTGEPAPGYLLRVPAAPRLVLLRLGGAKTLPAVPRPTPSPTPVMLPTPSATPKPEPRRP